MDHVTEGAGGPGIALAPLALDLSGDAGVGSVRIEPTHCTGPEGRQFLFGGMAMALGVRAFEAACGRPLICATMQFLARTKPGDVLEVRVDRRQGNSVAQAHLTGSVHGRPVIEASAALGERADGPQGQWSDAPPGPPPLDCPLVQAHADADRDAHAQIDIRVAQGRFGVFSRAPVSADRRVTAWMRPRAAAIDAAMLAFMADFVPSTTSNALERRAGGTSLDNTIRIARIVPTEWVRCDIRIDAMHGGIAHGRVAMFAEDGTLMALASQSYVARVLPDRRG